MHTNKGDQMVDFFDVNYWEKECDVNHISGINQAYSEISDKVVITNYFSLYYHWDYGNEKLLKNSWLENNNNIYFGFIITPDNYLKNDFEKYVLGCYRKKVRLFRFFPKAHCFYVYDNYMKKIFEILNSYQFPVMLDLKQLDITGNKNFAISDLETILNNHSDLPFILECSLKQLMFNSYFLPLLDKYENLYLEISGLLAVNQIENYVDKFGPERLIYGSNHPSIELEFTKDRIMLSCLDDQIKQQISKNNFIKVIRGISNG